MSTHQLVLAVTPLPVPLAPTATGAGCQGFTREQMLAYRDDLLKDVVALCNAERAAYLPVSADNRPGNRESDFAFGSVCTAERIAEAISVQIRACNSEPPCPAHVIENPSPAESPAPAPVVQPPALYAPGSWVAQFDSNADRPQIARVIEVYPDSLTEGEWLVDLAFYSQDGRRIGRLSPAMGGPKGYEPACAASRWVGIEKPDFKALDGSVAWGRLLTRRAEGGDQPETL